MDPQVVLDLLTSVDNSKLYFILGESLQSKPNLAPEMIIKCNPTLHWLSSQVYEGNRKKV